MSRAVFPPCCLTKLSGRPNCGGSNEGNGDLLQKVPRLHCHTQCPQPCSRPSPTHPSAGDSWTLTGKSGSVSCRVTAPFSWVLVHKVLMCPPRVYFPVLLRSGRSVVGLMVTSSKRAYVNPSLLHPEPLPLWQSTADPYLHRRRSNAVLSQSLWGPWALVLWFLPLS